MKEWTMLVEILDLKKYIARDFSGLTAFQYEQSILQEIQG